MFEYQIGDKKYFQKPLVLGQISQLNEYLKGINFSREMGMQEIISEMGEKLPKGLAIVLQEEGIHLKNKNLDETAEEIGFSIDPETAFKVIEDFFDCNPIASLLERLRGMIDTVLRKAIAPEKISSSISPKETLQNETISSGATPRKNAIPSSDIV